MLAYNLDLRLNNWDLLENVSFVKKFLNLEFGSDYYWIDGTMLPVFLKEFSLLQET